MFFRDRQREHKSIGIDAAGGETQQSAQCDRQHEQIDRQQIQRKQPDGFVQMPFVDVFHHRDLKLARQKQYRKHRQQRKGCPRRVGARFTVHRHQCVQLRIFACTMKNIRKAVIHAVGYEYAHGQERDEFDHGFKRDGGNQAFVTLCRIQMPRAEEDGKPRQHQCDIKRVVMHEPLRADFFGQGDAGIMQNNGKAGGNRFELQRDIGNDADHRDDCDQPAQQLTLAVARGHEVGDGGDAIGLADADHFQQHKPPQRRHQRGAEVDRQKADAGGCRATDAAVERPRSAVDRQRQRVDVRVGDEATALVRAFVAVSRDGEQQPDVSKRGDDDNAAAQHVSSWVA